MASQRIFLPASVRNALSERAEGARNAIEVRLENMAELVRQVPGEQLRQMLMPSRSGEGYVTEIDGERVHFSVDALTGLLFVHLIERIRSSGDDSSSN
jgi:hypothetical protein